MEYSEFGSVWKLRRFLIKVCLFYAPLSNGCQCFQVDGGCLERKLTLAHVGVVCERGPPIMPNKVG